MSLICLVKKARRAPGVAVGAMDRICQCDDVAASACCRNMPSTPVATPPPAGEMRQGKSDQHL